MDDPEDKEHINEFIRAAGRHDIPALERGILEYSFPDCRAVDVQDRETGLTPLHAAIISCVPTDGADHLNSESTEDRGAQVLRFLLENGAIWNQLDYQDETPGCLARRLGLSALYHMMVDAGVRAEMLLSRLEEYDQILDEDDSGGEDDDFQGGGDAEDDQDDYDESQPGERVNQYMVRQIDTTTDGPHSAAYLSSTLRIGGDKILDTEGNGVMMAWESDIMRQSAQLLLPRSGLCALNIGFGMGIIDGHIQSHPHKPAAHHIVEAHPDILEKMKETGWMDKPNVVVHRGKWQDVLLQLAEEGQLFDAVYFDTFAEQYAALREFFSEHVVGLLSDGGSWSFFNGMGADRQISYDVYQKIVEIDLMEAGFDVEWTTVELPPLVHEWDGVRRKYWNVDEYRLPLCRFTL